MGGTVVEKKQSETLCRYSPVNLYKHIPGNMMWSFKPKITILRSDPQRCLMG